MLQKSVKALKDQNVELANRVLSNKYKLANMDDDLEDRTLRLITLYQPMAKDMREIACILKMITYLTRIGRYGKDIAKLVEGLSTSSHIKNLVSIYHMSDVVYSMIDDALIVFEKKDITKFNDFVEREDDVDKLRYSIFRECVSYMMEDQKVI